MPKAKDALGLFDSALSVSLTLGGVAAAIGGGVLSYFLADAAAWMEQYQPWSTYMAGLIGSLLITCILIFLSLFRRFWIRGSLESKFAERQTLNPTQSTFERQRIYIHDLANPITGLIKNKQFSECELIGPANILFTGVGQMTKSSLNGCDLVAVQNYVMIHNTIIFEGCSLVNCDIYRCTIFGDTSFMQKLRQDFGTEMPLISTSVNFDE